MNVVVSHMNEIDLKKELKGLKKVSKHLLKSKKKARKFLIDVGINTKCGKLSKHYR